MLAKSVMVVGSLLTAAVLTVSTPVLAQNTAAESLYRFSTALNRFFDRLTEDDRRKYHQAMYTALGNLDNGEIIKWYSDTSYNHGTVEIVMTTRLSGRLCRRVYSEIRTERNATSSEHWACLTNDGTWDFHK